MSPSRAFIIPGDGTVARLGSAAVFVPPGSDPQRRDQLLAVLHDCAGGDPVATLRAVAGEALRLGFGAAPSFALALVGESTTHVLVLGDAVAVVETAAGVETLRGRDAVTWLERRIDAPVSSLALASDPAAAESAPGPWWIDEGVVPAAGLRVGVPTAPSAEDTAPAAEDTAPAVATVVPRAGREAEAPEAPAADGSDEATPLVIDLRDPQPETVPTPVPTPVSASVPPPPPPPPPPLGAAPAGTVLVAPPPPPPLVLDDDAPAPGEAHVVAGVRCTAGHLNRPGATSCARCAAAISLTSGTVLGPRPALGVLVVDDATRVVLDRPVVIGRRPPASPEVSGEPAQAVAIDDGALDDVHVEIQLDGWDLYVIDRSVDGSYLEDSSGRRTRLPRHARVKLRPGSALALGDHIVRLGVERTTG